MQEIVYYEVKGKRQKGMSGSKPSSTCATTLRRVVICSNANEAQTLRSELVVKGVDVTNAMWCMDCVSEFNLQDPAADCYKIL
jgi:hypothetical protein